MGSVTDDELYRKHADELIRFASTLVGPSLAEDVLGGAVTSALSSPSWPLVVNKRAFLFRCVATEAARHARSAQRRLRRERRVADAETVHDRHLDPDVVEAMLALSTRQRAVVYVTFWLDLTARDAAEFLGMSERTVERELARSRRTLERKLS